jgi:carbon storage regulator
MLVLSRKASEVILIGNGESRITIEVVRVQGDRVQIGITAPPDVKVLRGELEERKE